MLPSRCLSSTRILVFSRSYSVAKVSFPEHNVLDIIKENLSNKLSSLSGVDNNKVFNSIDVTSGLEKGDLIIPLPKIVAHKEDLVSLARTWGEKLSDQPYMAKVVANGPFLQFFIEPHYLTGKLLPKILEERERYGQIPLVKDKKVLIEFSSPNIAKPFHAGHLRSTIIGGFLSNLFQNFGWNVTKMNYLGDWGKQFGVLAVGFERYGDEKRLETDAINHLFEVYVKINKDIENEKLSNGKSLIDEQAKEYFCKLENNDTDAIKLWKKFRNLSIRKYKETYSKLNIDYDVYSGESQVSKETILLVNNMLQASGLLKESNGAKVVDLSKAQKSLGAVVVQKSDGTSLYITRDIAAAIERKREYNFDKMIYVVASQQDLHMKQLYQILKELKFEWATSLEHINFGMVQGMSTRKGTVIFLDNILEEAQQQMLSVMSKNDLKFTQVKNPSEIAYLIGTSAVMIQDMQSKRKNNYKFKWERMLTFEGDTGPYLEYAHSRLKSIELKNKHLHESLTPVNYELIGEQDALDLVRVMSRYHEVLKKALETREPSTLVTYLFKIAHQVSKCYRTVWVSGQPDDVAKARLHLFMASRQILYNGLKLLGVTPVDRM